MKKCPVCSIDLVNVDYEGFRLTHCTKCKGHLVPLRRLESIKRVEGKTEDELRAEASEQFQASSTKTLKCPRCRVFMKKEKIDLPVLDLQMDVCRKCELIWFDGGELALLQLGYQSKSSFLDAQEFKRRIQELDASPERKAEFEANLARMPAGMDPLGEAMEEVGRRILWGLASRDLPESRL